MSFKTTGILALLLVLLAGYIYLFEVRGREEQQRAEEIARRVAQVDRQEVAKLTLDTPDERIEAVKVGFEWRITSPVETTGDYESIEGLLVASESLEKAGVAADSSQVRQPGFSLADFGLLDPAIELAFEGSEDGVRKVAFGDRSPTGVYFYLQVEGDDQVYLARGFEYGRFDISLHDLRDKRYLRFDPDLLAGIVLESGEHRVAVAKEGLQWQVTEPLKDLGDDVSIGEFLTALRDVRIESFASPSDPSQTGLDDPWFTLTLKEVGEGGDKQLAFGKKTGPRAYRRYFARSTTASHVFEADSTFVHNLFDSGNHFRTKDIFSFNRDEVDQLEIIYPDSILAFNKQGYNQWAVSSPPGRAIAGERIEEFLDEVNVLRAMIYVSEGMADEHRKVFESQGIKVRLSRDGELVREIIVGALGNYLYAATNDREQVVEIEQHFLGRIRDVRAHPTGNDSQG